MKPIEFRGKETMSYNKTEKPLPPAEGAEQLTKEQFTAIIEDSVKDVWYGRRSMNPVKEQTELLVEKLYPLMNRQQPTAKGAEEIAQCCPVCGGNGLVPCGFYNQTSGHWGTTSITPETCRSCNGTGVVFATLHAQRLADKMVKERLQDELNKFVDFINNEYCGNVGNMLDIEDVFNYLKSREQ